MHYAAAGGHNDVISLLVELGDDHSNNGRNRLSPVHQAVMNGHVSTV